MHRSAHKQRAHLRLWFVALGTSEKHGPGQRHTRADRSVNAGLTARPLVSPILISPHLGLRSDFSLVYCCMVDVTASFRWVCSCARAKECTGYSRFSMAIFSVIRNASRSWCAIHMTCFREPSGLTPCDLQTLALIILCG